MRKGQKCAGNGRRGLMVRTTAAGPFAYFESDSGDSHDPRPEPISLDIMASGATGTAAGLFAIRDRRRFIIGMGDSVLQSREYAGPYRTPAWQYVLEFILILRAAGRLTFFIQVETCSRRKERVARAISMRVEELQDNNPLRPSRTMTQKTGNGCLSR